MRECGPSPSRRDNSEDEELRQKTNYEEWSIRETGLGDSNSGLELGEHIQEVLWDEVCRISVTETGFKMHLGDMAK